MDIKEITLIFYLLLIIFICCVYYNKYETFSNLKRYSIGFDNINTYTKEEWTTTDEELNNLKKIVRTILDKIEQQTGAELQFIQFENIDTHPKSTTTNAKYTLDVFVLNRKPNNHFDKSMRILMNICVDYSRRKVEVDAINIANAYKYDYNSPAETIIQYTDDKIISNDLFLNKITNAVKTTGRYQDTTLDFSDFKPSYEFRNPEDYTKTILPISIHSYEDRGRCHNVPFDINMKTDKSDSYGWMFELTRGLPTSDKV